MDQWPHFPLHLNSTALFGIILLLGLIGGELARRVKFLPIISGYIFIGFLIGPGGFNIANHSVLVSARIFVEISLSLILFELGRHLDFRWLYRDRGLLLMSLTESFLTFGMIFFIFYFFLKLSLLQAALAGTIAMATSAAVVLMVAHDLLSEGPVTRRTIVLTSLNNLYALIIFVSLLPFVQNQNADILTNASHVLYRLGGSFLLGIFMFVIAELIALFIGKNKQNQFILFVGLVTLSASLAHIFNLSTMLVLFTLGVLARNSDRRHLLMEVDFSWIARLFFVLLFVVTGAHIQLNGLGIVAGSIFIFILVRGLAKMLGVWLFASASNLSRKQVLAIGFALSPMAGVAIGMSNILADFNPDFGRTLLLIVTGVVAILHFFGPIATQLAFIKAGETLVDKKSVNDGE